MIQVMTIRQQVLAALDRVRTKLDDDYKHRSVVDKCWIELCDEFGPDAIALTPAADFDDMARQMGYVKVEPGKVIVDKIPPKFTEGQIPLSTRFEDVIEAMGYVKLAPDAILTTQAEMECIKRQFAELEARLEPGKVQVKRKTAEHLLRLLSAPGQIFTLDMYDGLVTTRLDLTAALEGNHGQG